MRLLCFLLLFLVPSAFAKQTATAGAVTVTYPDSFGTVESGDLSSNGGSANTIFSWFHPPMQDVDTLNGDLRIQSTAPIRDITFDFQGSTSGPGNGLLISFRKGEFSYLVTNDSGAVIGQGTLDQSNPFFNFEVTIPPDMRLSPIDLHFSFQFFGGHFLRTSSDPNCADISCMVPGQDTFQVSEYQLRTSQFFVPEPSTWLLILAGSLSMLILRNGFNRIAQGQLQRRNDPRLELCKGV
jgi:hypothetical protein